MRLVARRAFVLLLGSAFGGCGGAGEGPTEPSVPAAAASLATCRTYATSLTTSVTDLSGAASGTVTCLFDPAALTLHCTRMTTGAGCALRVTTSYYASVADFIEEATVFGRPRLLRSEAVTSGNCNGSTSSTIYTYDAERRVARIELRTDGNPTGSTTMTAWDALGRATRDTLTGGGCVDRPSVTTYDDLTRTSTSLGSGGGAACVLPPNVYTQSYDANGTLVRESYVSAGVPVITTTNTVVATAAVCP